MCAVSWLWCWRCCCCCCCCFRDPGLERNGRLGYACTCTLLRKAQGAQPEELVATASAISKVEGKRAAARVMLRQLFPLVSCLLFALRDLACACRLSSHAWRLGPSPQQAPSEAEALDALRKARSRKRMQRSKVPCPCCSQPPLAAPHRLTHSLTGSLARPSPIHSRTMAAQ